MSNSTNKLFAKLAHGFAKDPKIVGLSSDAFRAYVEALLYSCQYMTDGFLDDRIVQKEWGFDVAEELAANDKKQPSWVKVEGGWMIYAFCEWQTTTKDIAQMKAKKQAAGIKSGEVRREHKRTGVQQVLKHNLNKNEPETETETETDIKPLAISSPLFDEFWQLWPRREGKANAIKAWQKAIKKISESELVEKARAYVTSPTVPEKQFVPHAATWLNGERWNDEPDPVKPDLHHPPEDDWMYQDVKWGDARGE